MIISKKWHNISNYLLIVSSILYDITFLGISSQQALNKLIHDISVALQKSCSRKNDSTNEQHESNLPRVRINWRLCLDRNFLTKTFGVSSQTSLFSWAALLASFLHIVALLLCGGILLQVIICFRFY